MFFTGYYCRQSHCCKIDLKERISKLEDVITISPSFILFRFIFSLREGIETSGDPLKRPIRITSRRLWVSGGDSSFQFTGSPLKRSWCLPWPAFFALPCLDLYVFSAFFPRFFFRRFIPRKPPKIWAIHWRERKLTFSSEQQVFDWLIAV